MGSLLAFQRRSLGIQIMERLKLGNRIRWFYPIRGIYTVINSDLSSNRWPYRVGCVYSVHIGVFIGYSPG